MPNNIPIISANTSFIDKQFGIFPDALKVHEKGIMLVANNMAHKETPNFKAQGLDFKAALAECKEQLSTKSLTSTDKPKFSNLNLSNHIKYRTVMQPSANGNTVDPDVESTEFSKQTIRYYAALHFQEYAGKNLSTAIDSGRE
jgi:flagellar basal-body rod protein FlgB